MAVLKSVVYFNIHYNFNFYMIEPGQNDYFHAETRHLYCKKSIMFLAMHLNSTYDTSVKVIIMKNYSGILHRSQ